MLDEIATYLECCSLLYGKKNEEKYEKQTKFLIQETYLFCDS